MEFTSIRSLYRERDGIDHEHVRVGGWVKSIRASKSFGFIMLSAGTFFEGVMTFGYPSDDAINAVQKNIASMSYTQYPVSVTRITELVPGGTQDVTVAFTNPGGKTLKNFTIQAEVPEGWEIAASGNEPAELGASSSKSTLFILKAPQGRSAGYVNFTASWDGGSFSSAQRIRSAEALKINEVSLSTPGGLDPQFIELYNAGDKGVDLSGLNLVVRRSGWAPVTAAVIPAGTVLEPGSFFLMTEAEAAASIAAPKGGNKVFLTKALSAGTGVTIGGKSYTISEEGVPAGAQTTIFSPVSTGPKLSIPAGATNIPVASIAGFAAGQTMGLDLGGNFETFTVTSVGTPAVQTTLAKEAKAGDTTLSIDVTSTLIPGSELIISTGDRMEKAIVKEVVKVSEAPAPRVPGQRPSMTPREPGVVTIEQPLKNDHMTGGDVSCTGTGITFTPATKFDHMSGDAVQPLGSAYTLSSALESDVAMFEAVSTDHIVKLADMRSDMSCPRAQVPSHWWIRPAELSWTPSYMDLSRAVQAPTVQWQVLISPHWRVHRTVVATSRSSRLTVRISESWAFL